MTEDQLSEASLRLSKVVDHVDRAITVAKDAQREAEQASLPSAVTDLAAADWPKPEEPS